MAYPDFNQEPGIGLARPGFEEAAERMGTYIGYPGNLFQLNDALEIFQTILVDLVDPLIFPLLEIMPEANGRQRFYLLGPGNTVQRFH